MSTDTSFVLRAELKSPIIPGRRLMLDALLSGLLFGRLGDPERAIRQIPLARVDRVWCGSQVLLEGACAAVPVVYTNALRAERDLSRESVRSDSRGGSYPRIEAARGPYRNRLTEFVSYEARAVWFCGRGDPEAIMDLLDETPAIGTKRSSGFGALDRHSIDIEEVEAEWSGIMFSDGTPARTVPVETWRSIGGSADAEMTSEAATLPYWRTGHETCVVPSHLVVSREDAERLTGISS